MVFHCIMVGLYQPFRVQEEIKHGPGVPIYVYIALRNQYFLLCAYCVIQHPCTIAHLLSLPVCNSMYLQFCTENSSQLNFSC